MGWVVALVLGIALGLVIGRRRGAPRRRSTGSRPPASPVDAVGEIVPELILRANRAAHLCLTAETDGVAHWAGEALDARTRDRVEASARLAAADGRRHVIHDEEIGSIVAVGRDGVGTALLVRVPAAGPDLINRVADDLERFLRGEASVAAPPEETEPYRPAVDSVAGIAFDLCEQARRVVGRPALVVHRPVGENGASMAPVVVAGSVGADRRLMGLPVGADSLAARACDADQMLTTSDASDILGRAGEDRRRPESGVAVPLRDGNQGVGALIVLAAPDSLTDQDRERLVHAAARLGPGFAAASAVKVAEDRAVTDPLTGLPNRTALARAMSGWRGGPCSLLGVDIDHFKALNDTHGHAAGDSALCHVADILRRALRDQDLPARVGGEEFALWLPGVSRQAGIEVAERVRAMVQDLPWETEGKRVPITCSIGVASVPETTRSTDNLITAADAALYRAKERGRNRVEVASN